MKNIKYILAFILPVIWLSCKKDQPTQPVDNNELHDVSFKVSGFTQEHTGLKINTAGNPYDDYYEKQRSIYLYIFDANGKPLRTTTQTENMANFGNIQEKLPAGIYTLIFVGATVDKKDKDYLVEHIYFLAGYVGANDLDSFYGQYSATFMRETFYKKINLIVGNSNISQNISLDRIVGQMQVNVEDAIPNNVSEIMINIDQAAYAFKLSTGEPLARTDVELRYNATAFKGKKNFKATVYTLPEPATPYKITISGIGAEDAVIAKKVISGVTTTVNGITYITGNLFGGNTGSAPVGNVKADSTWNQNIIYKSF